MRGSVAEVEVAVDYQSLGIGFSHIGSIQIEVLDLSPDQDQSLLDETAAHHECERHPNVREVEGSGDAGTEHTDAAPIDQTTRGGIFAEPHNKRSVDVSVMRPLLRSARIVGGVIRIEAGASRFLVGRTTAQRWRSFSMAG